MQKFFDNVFDRNGSVIAGAVVTVSDAATGALSTIYSSNSLGIKANPITCDSNGYFEFYAANGRYTLTVTGGALTTRVVQDVLLEDITGTGADLVGFTPAGTGAVVRTSQDKMRDVVSVKDFGATGDGTTNDQAAIQAAIDAVSAAGGGTVFFPAGTYKAVAKRRTSNPSDNHSYDGHPIVINASNVVLRGAGREDTTIQFRAFGDLSNASSWQVVSGQVFRGGGVFIRAGTSSGTMTQNVGIYGLTLDGGAGYTGVRTFPADISTGDGWDLTHKGVWLENDRFHDAITVADCTIRNFRGELNYQGGPNGGSFTVERNEITSTNGDGFSSSAGNVVRHNRIHLVATSGIECAMDGPDKIYHRNEIYDCDKEGISISQGVATSRARVVDNVLRKCTTGILLTSPSKVIVERNTLIDCGLSPSNVILLVSTTANPAKDVTIRGNRIICDTRNVNLGVAIADSGTATLQNVRIYDNDMDRTRAAVAAPFAILQGCSFATTSIAPEFESWGNNADSTFQDTRLSAAEETLLATTGATVIAERRPDKNRNYMAMVYVEVLNAITTLTLVVKWTGSDGVQTTTTLEAAAAKAVGRYTYTPVFVHAYGANNSQKVQITATAGTANNIKVSASIVQVPFA